MSLLFLLPLCHHSRLIYRSKPGKHSVIDQVFPRKTLVSRMMNTEEWAGGQRAGEGGALVFCVCVCVCAAQLIFCL